MRVILIIDTFTERQGNAVAVVSASEAYGWGQKLQSSKGSPFHNGFLARNNQQGHLIDPKPYQEGGQLSLISFFKHHSFILRFRYGDSPKPPTRKSC
jgi:hypothetical protein